MKRLAPSILSADFCRIADTLSMLENAGVSMIHVDVMDGHFVPNISIGLPVVHSLRQNTQMMLDVHLMISNPENYIGAFRDAGADILTIHVEVSMHLNRLLQQIRKSGMKVGISLNPATPTILLEEVLSEVDQVLVMSVNPGFGGQYFIPASLRRIGRIRSVRDQQNLRFKIEVDGGIGLSNLEQVLRAGADVIVAGSAIFCAENPADEIVKFRSILANFEPTG